MNGIENDLSLNTIIISGVVALVGYGLKSVGKALIDAIIDLVKHLVSTTAKVQMLEAKLSELIRAVGDVEKIRTDLNRAFSRIKELDDKFKNSDGH